MKKIVLIFLCICAFMNAKGVIGLNQTFDKQSAIQNAHWNAFENILTELVGQYSYKGSIKKSFKKDFQKDFEEFKNEYFDFSTYQCENKQDDGFLCQVRGNINVDKIRAIISEKSNETTTMGKDQMSNLNIVLIDDISNENSKDFVSYLQADLNNSGHSFVLLGKGTPVGKKGNKCKSFEEKLKKYKKKGSSYESAVRAVQKKLDDCKENQDVEYAFSLDKLKIINAAKSTHGEYKSTLTYRIIMFNTQKGKRDQSIKPHVVTAYAQDTETLKLRLFEKASLKASSEMTSNLLGYISKKQKKNSKKTKKMKKFDYMYTVILMDITNDGSDRGKRKLIRDAIKKFNAKPVRNSKESKDHEQVYNFGTNDDIDLEDFVDSIYDLADSIGIPVQITDDGNNILNIQFQ